MAAHQREPPVIPPGSQQLDWEVPHNYQAHASVPPKEDIYSNKQHKGLRTTVVELLGKTLQNQQRYIGRRRRFFLCALSAVIVLVVLAIGLGVGLTRHSGYVPDSYLKILAHPLLFSAEDLPLPSNTQTFTGDLTYYSPALGACGITSSDSDDICAVSHTLFDTVSKGSNPNANPLCGLMIRATRFDEQVNANRSVDLKVVDRCGYPANAVTRMRTLICTKASDAKLPTLTSVLGLLTSSRIQLLVESR